MSPRRRIRRGRLALVALVVTLVVVVTASGVLHGARSNHAFRILVDRTFAATASAATTSSSALDPELLAVVVAGPHASRMALQADLDTLQRTAAAQAAFAAATMLPGPDGGAARAFVAAMGQRAKGVRDLRAAIDGLCDLHSSSTISVPVAPPFAPTTTPAGAAALLARAATAFNRAEQDFANATAALARSPGHVHLTVAPWSQVEGALTPVGQQQFLAALQGSATLAPVHHLAISVLALDPPALPLQSTPTHAVLLPTSTLDIGVVVANEGNVEERPVAVVVNVEPLDGTGVRQYTDHVAVAAASSVSVDHPGIPVHAGHHYRVVISVLAPAGDPPGAGAQRTIDLTVAAG